MENYENIDFKRILGIIFSKKLFIAVILIFSLVLGYVYSYYYKTPQYNSFVKILLVADESQESKEVTQTDLSINSSLISTYSSIAKSANVIDKTIKNLKLDMPIEKLQRNVEVTQINNTQFLKISVKNESPEMAKDIANEIAYVFAEQIKQIYNIENIKIVDEAEVQNQPCNVNHYKDMIIFTFVGIFISSILVMLIYILDDTIKDERDIELNVNLRNIGTLPKNKKKDELIIQNNPKSYIVECIKTIRTNILYATNKKTILFTSTKHNEGKSWIINNMAVAFAQADKKVILVDTDLRKESEKNEIFNIEKKEGLSDFIKEISENKLENLEKAQKYIQETEIPNLHILQNGTLPPNPAELISSNNMINLLELLKSMYDIILLDGTSSMLVSDSIALSSMVDNTILVAESKKTKIRDLKKIKKSIEDVNGKILGVISNKIELQGGKYYGKKYGYYSLEETDELNEKENVEEKTKILSLENIIKETKEKIKEELLNKEELLQEKNEIIEENKQSDYQIKIIKDEIISEIKMLKNTFAELKKDNTKNQLDKINKEIAIIKETQDNKSKQLLEKIEEINNEEKLKEINEKIEKINNEEMLEEITKKLEVINYEEKFEEINNGLINNKEEYYNKIEEIKEKNKEEAMLIVQKFMKQIENSNNEINTLKEIQLNTNLELFEKLQNINNEEDLEKINEKIDKMKHRERLEKMEYDERLEKINEKIERINYEKRLEEINNKLINNKEEYSRKIEEIEEKDKENLSMILQRFMEEVNKLNVEIKNLKEMQVNSNSKLLEKIERINYEEKIAKINQKISENKLENTSNIISFESLKEKSKRLPKRIFKIDESINYEDLEKLSACVIDLNEEVDGMAISN